MRAPKWWTKICEVLAVAWHSWFKDVVLTVGKLIIQVLQEEGLRLIKELVKVYMDKDMSGATKRAEVFEHARSSLAEMGKNIPSSVINFAIELFVSEYKANKDN